VHAEVTGLRPDREYYYRFRVGTQLSPVGRTRTAPADRIPMIMGPVKIRLQRLPGG
jgi:phosphodiesterase/alkaline phosphatase D-like protein